MKYYSIIFLQRSDDFDSFVSEDGSAGIDAFFDADSAEQLRYLEQWLQDNPESYEECSGAPWGSSDDVEEFPYGNGVLIMSANSGLGYAGLAFATSEKNRKDA